MTRHRTIVALLAAVAVLLGLNLLRGTPEAEAQGMGRPPQAVTMLVRQEEFGTALYRLWSDGTVELNQQVFTACCGCQPVEWCGWQVVPE